MPVRENGITKNSFSALAGVVSGFTMGNEFNGLSKTAIMCGTQFHSYLPFQDDPEDAIDGLMSTIENINSNILGALTSVASVLGNEKMFMQVFCVMSGKVSQAAASACDIKKLMKVVAGGTVLATLAKERVATMLKEFIPHNISNKIVLGTLDVEAEIEAWMKQVTWMIRLPAPFSTTVPIPMSVITAAVSEDHKEHNMEILLNGIPQEDGTMKQIYCAGEYIENQYYWKDVKFGISDMSYSGCEIIATYNALKALGEPVSEQTAVDLIAMYENNGAVLGGKFGSSPYAIEDYFREQGYDVMTTTSQDPSIINKIGEDCDTVIVNAYNNKDDITAMIHTVSITKEEGTYSVHNAYYVDSNNNYAAKDGYGTLQEAIDAISRDESASIDVIGISNARIGDFVDPEESAGGARS